MPWVTAGGEEGTERGTQRVRLGRRTQRGHGHGLSQRVATASVGRVRRAGGCAFVGEEAFPGPPGVVERGGQGLPRSSATSAGVIQSTSSRPAAVKARWAAHRARLRWVAGHAASTASRRSPVQWDEPACVAADLPYRRLGSRPPQDRVSARTLVRALPGRGRRQAARVPVPALGAA